MRAEAPLPGRYEQDLRLKTKALVPPPGGKQSFCRRSEKPLRLQRRIGAGTRGHPTMDPGLFRGLVIGLVDLPRPPWPTGPPPHNFGAFGENFF